MTTTTLEHFLKPDHFACNVQYLPTAHQNQVQMMAPPTHTKGLLFTDKALISASPGIFS